MDPQPPAETPPAEPPAPPAPATAPAWTPPPAPPPAPVAPPERPGSVTTASIMLMVIGVLVTLFGLFFLLVGTLLGGVLDTTTFPAEFGNLRNSIAGIFAVIGIIVAGFGILEVLSGIFMLSRRSWARILAIILSVLGGLVSLGGVAGGTDPRGAIVLPLVFLACYIFIIWAAAAHGKWFAGR